MKRFPNVGRCWWALVLCLLPSFWREPGLSRGAEAEGANFLTGSWELSWSRFGETNVDRLLLTQRVDQVTGRAFGDLDVAGSFTANKLELKFLNREKKEVLSLSGNATGEVLSGS